MTQPTPPMRNAGVHSNIRGRGETRLPRINAAAGTPHRSHAIRRRVKSFSVQLWGMITLGPASGQRPAQSRRPERRFLGTTAGAAVGQLPIDDDGGHAADAIGLGLRGHRRPVHVQALHLAGWTRVDEGNRLLARRAPRAEDLDLSLRTHDDTSVTVALVEPVASGTQAEQGKAVARPCQTIHTKSTTSIPTPPTAAGLP